MAEPAVGQVSCPPSPTSHLLSLAPPLKWAGGKRWLVSVIRDLWTGFEGYRLVEPFVGGLSVALALRPSRALLNDINPHLINFYRCLQQGLRIDMAFENERQHYNRRREQFNKIILTNQGVEPCSKAAQLFYYLNRTGFNGLCRFNRRGSFNVPFGRYSQINYASAEGFMGYSDVLSNWAFLCGDFASLELRPNDFVYADPPYDVEFTQYSQHGFAWDKQVALAKWLSTHTGPVVASNQATDRILELYDEHGFDVYTLPGPRRIACNGDRSPAIEMLAVRNLTCKGSLALAGRNTTTGQVLENMVLPALERGGYQVETQVRIGQRPGGRKQVVDAVISLPGRAQKHLISLKWQQVSGTAEQKVPFEILSLADAVKSSSEIYAGAYLVLGGPGWTLREYYLSGGLREYMHSVDSVRVLSLEDFVARANQALLD